MTVNHEVIGFAQNWRAEKALKTLGFQGFWLFWGSLPDTNSDVKFLKSSKNGGPRQWRFWKLTRAVKSLKSMFWIRFLLKNSRFEAILPFLRLF